MDLIHNLATGFGVAFTFTNLLYCLVGCIAVFIWGLGLPYPLFAEY